MDVGLVVGIEEGGEVGSGVGLPGVYVGDEVGFAVGIALGMDVGSGVGLSAV